MVLSWNNMTNWVFIDIAQTFKSKYCEFISFA